MLRRGMFGHKTPSILIYLAAEDARFCETVGALLSLDGIVSLSVKTLTAMQAVLGKHIPDGVIVDADLWGQSGTSALADIHRRWPTLSLIVTVSQPLDPPYAVELTAAGASSIFEKPIDARRLLTVIRRHTGEVSEKEPADRDGHSADDD